MLSPKRSDASRVNGRKSKGPITAAGKSRTRHNALKHELTTIDRFNPGYTDQILSLAALLCGGEHHPLLMEQATIIAENDLVLRAAGARQHLRAGGTHSPLQVGEDLRKSERYLRRAFSKKRKALVRFIRIKEDLELIKRPNI